MSARRCHCGQPIQIEENGDLRCWVGHSQPEAVGDLVRSLAALFAGPLSELREEIREKFDEQGAEFQSLREAVEALRAPEPVESGVEWVDLATEARRVGRSPEYMRREARNLGGRQSKPRGRWWFNPPTTDARLASLEGGEAKPARLAPSPRPLPGSVPLLDVKGRAA